MTVLDPKKIPKPAKNSSANNYIQDVLGNKTDNISGDSLYALAHINEEHNHSPSKVYPTLASTPDITTGTPAWTLGTFQEIVPVNTITSPFDIHHIAVEHVDTVTTYELVLYRGAVSSEVEIGRVRYSKTTNIATVSSQPFQTAILPANTRISARVASQSGNNDDTGISIFYHTY